MENFEGVESVESHIEGLEALHALLKIAEPRVKCHARTIFEMLIRLLYEITKSVKCESDERHQTLFNICAKCLKLSAKFAPDEFKLLCDKMNEIEVNKHFDTVIKDIFFDITLETTKVTDDNTFTICMQKP